MNMKMNRFGVNTSCSNIKLRLAPQFNSTLDKVDLGLFLKIVILCFLSHKIA